MTKISNPGQHWAAQAAVRIGAQVIAPPTKGDWNDVHCNEGLEAVTRALQALPDIREPEPDYDDFPEVGPSYEDLQEEDDSPIAQMQKLVRPLGYDDGAYYFLPKLVGQVVSMSPSALNIPNNLFQLMTRDQWARIMGGGELDVKDLVKFAGSTLMEMCQRVGIYSADRVRGAGAWPHGDSAVINTGDYIYDCATGNRLDHNDMPGREVYVRSQKAYNLDCKPLNNKDAHQLRVICDSLTWRRGMSGTILAGWMVLAGVGGALFWRPHVFVTGPAGSGKSTVMNEIIDAMLASFGIRMDGGSTEPGLRREVGHGSLPVTIDEFEAENKRDAESVEKILGWARKASSGGYVVNANVAARARSCVCFAAINPRIIKTPDLDRITVLELLPDRTPGADDRFTDLMRMIHDTITPEYANRMLKRTVDNMDNLLYNIKVFTKFATKKLGSKRDGDQIGALLAGAYMLNSTKRVSDDVAREWIDAQDWKWQNEVKEGTDADALIEFLMTSLVDYTIMDRTAKVPLADLIWKVRYGNDDQGAAKNTLGRYGISVSGDKLQIANRAARLTELLRDTDWMAYKNTLSRVDGAVSGAGSKYFSAGVQSRYMEIPLDGIMKSGSDAAEVEIDFD